MYQIGTMSRWGTFEPDTLGNDPTLTTYETLDAAQAAIHVLDVFQRNQGGDPITDGAIIDTETNQIVWRQE